MLHLVLNTFVEKIADLLLRQKQKTYWLLDDTDVYDHVLDANYMGVDPL